MFFSVTRRGSYNEQWTTKTYKGCSHAAVFAFLYHLELINQNLGGPLTNFNDWGGGEREGGGPTEVHILYPKKSQLQNLSTQKNHYLY